MSKESNRENEYDDQFVARLELIWGKGFLSPGGPGEVRALLEGTEVRGREVLDIGCGTGGVDVLLVENHGAGKVVGIDVEQPLIDRAIKLALEKRLLEKLEFILVEPGPLPFAEGSFDIVFSKDAILQIPNKPSLFEDVYRVLRPGGVFVASDWLKADEGKLKTLQEFLDASSFTSNLETPVTTKKLLQSSGFIEVHIRDRTAWARDDAERGDALILGEYKERAIELMGAEKYDVWFRIRRGKIAALESEELRPSHLFARKPDHA